MPSPWLAPILHMLPLPLSFLTVILNSAQAPIQLLFLLWNTFNSEHFPLSSDSHVPCLCLNDRLCPNSFCPGPLCTSERLGVVRSLIDLHGEAAWLLTPWEPWGPRQLSLSVSEELLRNLHFANEEHNSQRNDVILPQIPQPVGEQMGVSNPWSTGKIRLEEQPGAKYWPLLQSSTSSAAEVSWRLWTGVRIFSTSLLFTETINNYNQSMYYPENHKGKII